MSLHPGLLLPNSHHEALLTLFLTSRDLVIMRAILLFICSVHPFLPGN